MARIVMKFGGTSVADLDRIRNVAVRVKRQIDQGDEVAVVVSAMAGATNQLVGWCQALSPLFDAREYDAVVATGEQVTAGLLAIALQNIGVEARSWMGWQVAVETDGQHGKARINSIDGEELTERILAGQVPVVAGFQGIGPDNRVTTLGRGGSDTSAVALAAALKADRCDIYTDVDGVYTTDPRIVPAAKKLSKITYEEMLELASVGAKVLQTRSVELAMKERVRVQVLSSFSDAPGTMVVDEDEIVEQEIVAGIAYARDGQGITEDPCVTDMNALLDSVVCDYGDAGKAVRLSGHCERPLLTRPRTLRRIISNLLDNALKFGKDPELLFLSDTEEGVAIVVRDAGPGIPEDQMSDVLRPFYRIESSRNRETGGTGLGLAIAKQLTQQLHGTLNMRNRDDGGLEVRVSLPLKMKP